MEDHGSGEKTRHCRRAQEQVECVIRLLVAAFMGCSEEYEQLPVYIWMKL